MDAERFYLAAVASDPRRIETRGRLGFLYTEGEQYGQAFAQWDAFLASNPDSTRALYKFEAEGPSSARAH